MPDQNDDTEDDEIPYTITKPLTAADARKAGEGSVVYNEADVPEMDNEKDGRVKRVLINHDLVPEAGDLLVDTVRFDEGVGIDRHYHEGTDHFFYVLEGEGIIEIEGEEYDLEPGTVVWIGEGDVHQLYTEEGQTMRIFEYVSNNHHEAVHLEGDPTTWNPHTE